MPSYDYRCNHCGRTFALFYKSFKDYDPQAEHRCPHCDSADTARRIRRVTIARADRDLSKLDAGEMLSVLDGGDSREVGRLFQQVADSTGEDMGGEFNEATRRLLKGDSLERVEKDLSAGGDTGD